MGPVPIPQKRPDPLPDKRSQRRYSLAKAPDDSLSESLFQLHKPPGAPSVQIIFFHGFQVGEDSEPHLSTWRSEDDSTVWPQTWLVDEFPGAQVFTVAYKAELLRNSRGGKVDMYIIAENIVSDLLQDRIGQNPHCPIVLVGHSLGGLVMKELCLQAHSKNTPEHETFLSAIKAFFFYSTPHYGIPNVGVLARFLSDSPLLEDVETLNKRTARMNSDFERLVKRYGWQIAGVGETLATKLNPFPAFLVVPESSARYYGDFYLISNVDHVTVCKPIMKTSSSFNRLVNLLRHLSISSVQLPRPENYQHLPRVLVGMEGALDTLKIKLRRARGLGLAGMGGIGKSTLARALFNVLESQYEYTCFIKDVKDVTKSVPIEHGILLNLHHWGKKMGKENANNLWVLKGKRLLLILDDVASEERDLEIVAMLQDTIGIDKGSRIVVTSRDGALLIRCVDAVHNLEFLGLDISRELFVSHAFPKGVPSSVGDDMIDDIVEKCGQLPLALEVMGKHLYKKDESIWSEAKIALNKPRTIQGSVQERLMSSLRLSYDGLAEEEKEIFLDAATNFYGASLLQAKNAWRMTLKETFWKHLLDLSLVWEGERWGIIVVSMHEQLRSLATQIALIPGGLGRRLWKPERAWEVLLNYGSSSDDVKDIVALNLDSRSLNDIVREGIVALQPEKIGCWQFLDSLKKHVLQWCGGIFVDVESSREYFSLPTTICIPRSILCKMGNLRYLRLSGVDIDGDPVDELPSTLFSLVWENASFAKLLFNPALHKRMTVLSLFSDRLGSLPSNFGQLSGLEVLIINGKLKSLPNSFRELLSLRELVFFNCEFVELPEIFGDLRNLKWFTLFNARKLKMLPVSVVGLSQLQSLNLINCGELEAFPDCCGGLKSLKELKLTGIGKLKDLPQSLGDLSELKSLDTDGCNDLLALPDSFGRLRNLKNFVVSDAGKLKALPQSFGNLSELKSLELDCCELEALPDSFGRLRNLNTLEIRKAGKLKALPQSFGDLSELESLRVHGCCELESLPNSFGQLRNLKQFQLSHAKKLKGLSESFGDLSELVSLWLNGCHELEALPDSFGRLRSLRMLEFSDAEKLKALPLSVGDLSLSSLRLDGCSELEALRDSFGLLGNI